jgi:hypothetical protein
VFVRARDRVVVIVVYIPVCAEINGPNNYVLYGCVRASYICAGDLNTGGSYCVDVTEKGRKF